MLSSASPSWTFDISNRWSMDRTQPSARSSISGFTKSSKHNKQQICDTQRARSSRLLVEDSYSLPDKALSIPNHPDNLVVSEPRQLSISIPDGSQTISSTGLKTYAVKTDPPPSTNMIIDLTDDDEPTSPCREDLMPSVFEIPAVTAPPYLVDASLSLSEFVCLDKYSTCI
jgi:hypothetical protein